MADQLANMAKRKNRRLFFAGAGALAGGAGLGGGAGAFAAAAAGVLLTFDVSDMMACLAPLPLARAKHVLTYAELFSHYQMVVNGYPYDRFFDLIPRS